jgi:hypothetical protein
MLLSLLKRNAKLIIKSNMQQNVLFFLKCAVFWRPNNADLTDSPMQQRHYSGQGVTKYTVILCAVQKREIRKSVFHTVK